MAAEPIERGDEAGADKMAAELRYGAHGIPPTEVKIGDETFPVVRTDDSTAHFGMAAVRNPDGTISGVHVTDDRARAGEAVRAGQIADPEKGGDLGPGLYVSNAPQLWVGRAHSKWSFLEGMGEEDRTKLAAALRTSLVERRGLSEGERKHADWLIDDFEQSGHPHAVSMLADQPYVISFWKPEYLADLAIEPGPQPKQVPVKLRGHFVECSRGVLMREESEQLMGHSVDGVFVKGGMSGYPQLVVWNPEAIVEFGSIKPMHELSEIVVNRPQAVERGLDAPPANPETENRGQRSRSYADGLTSVRPGELGPGINPNAKTERLKREILESKKAMPIEIAHDGFIVDGEHRYKVLCDLGVQEIPTFVGT